MDRMPYARRLYGPPEITESMVGISEPSLEAIPITPSEPRDPKTTTTRPTRVTIFQQTNLTNPSNSKIIMRITGSKKRANPANPTRSITPKKRVKRDHNNTNYNFFFPQDGYISSAVKMFTELYKKMKRKDVRMIAMMANRIEPGSLITVPNMIAIFPSKLSKSTLYQINRYLEWYLLPVIKLARRLTDNEKKLIIADVTAIEPINHCAIRDVMLSIHNNYCHKRNCKSMVVDTNLNDNILIELAKFVDVHYSQMAKLSIRNSRTNSYLRKLK